jgi:phosphomannomutase / phosphoglucomutase
VNPNLFREYDIRGRVPEELNQETAYRLGQCFGAYYRGFGAKRISLGRDCRLSSPELRLGVLEGMMDAGMDVKDLGMVPTPLLYFSLHHLDVDGGIQITGSHNPPEYNGFKICLGKTTIYGEEIQKLRKIGESGSFPKEKGSVEAGDVVQPYGEEVLKRIRCGQEARKVVLDAGNGVGGLVAPELYARMGVEVEKLFCEPDGLFPNHHPDPTLPENLRHLVQRVSDTSADLGIAFDGDADRIGVVDRRGKVLWGDQLMIIFSRDLLKRHPGAKIIGEVKCSQVLYDDIRKNGGVPIMWKAGHSLIKAKMKEEGALLAGEMSGHLFFAERYFGYDDAIYAGARLLEILTSEKRELDELLAGVPSLVSTPEIRLDCPDDRKFQIVADLASEFKKEYQVIDVDGARVVFKNGWGLIRASNTQPVLVLRFEAEDQKTLGKIQKVFTNKLAKRGLKVQ